MNETDARSFCVCAPASRTNRQTSAQAKPGKLISSIFHYTCECTHSKHQNKVKQLNECCVTFGRCFMFAEHDKNYKFPCGIVFAGDCARDENNATCVSSRLYIWVKQNRFSGAPSISRARFVRNMNEMEMSGPD